MKHPVAAEPEKGDPSAEITLLGFRSSISPACTKVETMLRICGLDYSAKIGDITSGADAPKHKVCDIASTSMIGNAECRHERRRCPD
jgi:hypothetical protein